MAETRKPAEIAAAGYLGANLDLAIRCGHCVVIITDCEGAELIGAGLEILSPDDPEDRGRQARAVQFATRVQAAAA